MHSKLLTVNLSCSHSLQVLNQNSPSCTSNRSWNSPAFSHNGLSMCTVLHSVSMNLLFVWYPQSLSHQCCLWLWEAFYKLSRWMARLRSKQGSLKTDHTWNEPSASHFVSSVWLTHACFFPMTPSTLAGPQPRATWLHWHNSRTPRHFSFFHNFCTFVPFLISPQYFTLWLTRNSERDPFQVLYNYMFISESLN